MTLMVAIVKHLIFDYNHVKLRRLSRTPQNKFTDRWAYHRGGQACKWQSTVYRVTLKDQMTFWEFATPFKYWLKKPSRIRAHLRLLCLLLLHENGTFWEKHNFHCVSCACSRCSVQSFSRRYVYIQASQSKRPCKHEGKFVWKMLAPWINHESSEVLYRVFWVK